jgi:hypothetical protein
MGEAQRPLSYIDWQTHISRCLIRFIRPVNPVPKGRLKVAQDDSPGYKIKT